MSDFLFGGSSSSGGSLYSLLTEYNNIKNGSYYKVVKAYYAKKSASTSDTKDSSKSKNGVSEETKKLNAAQTDAKAVSSAAEELMTKGDKSVFALKDIKTTDEDGNETVTKGYDTDAIYKAVKKFTDSYNSLLDSASSTDSKSILNSALNMTNNTKSYEKLLNKVGITIGSNNKLTIDEKAFKAADMSTVKTLFNGSASFANSVATKASMINISASSEANKTSMYTNRGSYNNSYSSGSLLNSLF